MKTQQNNRLRRTVYAEWFEVWYLTKIHTRPPCEQPQPVPVVAGSGAGRERASIQPRGQADPEQYKKDATGWHHNIPKPKTASRTKALLTGHHFLHHDDDDDFFNSLRTETPLPHSRQIQRGLASFPSLWLSVAVTKAQQMGGGREFPGEPRAGGRGSAHGRSCSVCHVFGTPSP